MERRFVTGLGALVPQKPVGKPALRWEDGRRRWMARFGRFWPLLAFFGRFWPQVWARAARTWPAGATAVLKPMHSQRWRAVRHSHTGRRRDGARRPSVSRTRDDAIVCQRTTPSGMTPCVTEKDPGSWAFGQPSATPIAVENITTTGSEFKQENGFQSRTGGATAWPQQGPQDRVGMGS